MVAPNPHPPYTHEYYEEEQTRKIIGMTVCYHFTSDQVDRIIAALRKVEIINAAGL